jgi:hypothetical protein
MGTTAAVEERRPPVDWRRATDGIQLAGFAVFLLLNTTGVLPWSIWLDAIALWPVLLMSAGLRMAVDRSRAPWLQLLSPVLVLGALSWLAFSAHRPILSARDWTAVSLPRADGVDRMRLEGQLLGTRFAAVAAPLGPGALVEGRMASRRGTARIAAPVDGTTAELRVEGPRRGGPWLWAPGASDQWDLRLDGSLPLTVKLGGAMSRVDLDLSAGRLERGAVEGVFIGTDLRLPRPERDTEVKIAGVFNAVTISVPEGTPVRVHGPGLPFNIIDRGAHGSGPGYDVNLGGIFSAATVETRPGEPALAASPGSDAGAAKPAPSPAGPLPSRPPAEAPVPR